MRHPLARLGLALVLVGLAVLAGLALAELPEHPALRAAVAVAGGGIVLAGARSAHPR